MIYNSILQLRLKLGIAFTLFCLLACGKTPKQAAFLGPRKTNVEQQAMVATRDLLAKTELAPALQLYIDNHESFKHLDSKLSALRIFNKASTRKAAPGTHLWTDQITTLFHSLNPNNPNCVIVQSPAINETHIVCTCSGGQINYRFATESIDGMIKIPVSGELQASVAYGEKITFTAAGKCLKLDVDLEFEWLITLWSPHFKWFDFNPRPKFENLQRKLVLKWLESIPPFAVGTQFAINGQIKRTAEQNLVKFNQLILEHRLNDRMTLKLAQAIEGCSGQLCTNKAILKMLKLGFSGSGHFLYGDRVYVPEKVIKYLSETLF